MDSSDDVSVVLNNSTSSTASKYCMHGSIYEFFSRNFVLFREKNSQVKKIRTNKSLRI